MIEKHSPAALRGTKVPPYVLSITFSNKFIKNCHIEKKIYITYSNCQFSFTIGDFFSLMNLNAIFLGLQNFHIFNDSAYRVNMGEDCSPPLVLIDTKTTF